MTAQLTYYTPVIITDPTTGNQSNLDTNNNLTVNALTPAPVAANILCGLATTSGATIITIPANRVWVGTVHVSASLLVASGGAAVSGSARVSVAGTGATPAAGDYLRVDLSAPSSVVLTGNGTNANQNGSSPLTVIAPAGNSVTLVLNTTNTTTQSASAIGQLL